MSRTSSILRTQTIRLLVRTLVFSIFCLSGLSQAIQAQTAAFTYQGKLTDGGSSANGPYDLTFKLFSLSDGGTQIGSDVVRDDVQATAGIFTVNLDFGPSPFTSDTGRYLEISVRAGASTGAFTLLTPRQPLTSAPYSVSTIRAASAAVADNATQLGGVNASEYVQTTDTRMSDARIPLAGSSNYIQSNPATQQPETNLNIGGNAAIGGTLAGNVVNAATQYNLGANRVLSVAGTNNFFAGVGAGANNTGTGNSFVGREAGQANTTGQANAFFGFAAGQSNTSGNFNAFFGSGTGSANVGGGENSFFGYTAGRFNTSGSINAFFGKSAGLFNTTGSANSFFGYDAGSLNTSGTNNTFVGVIAGDANTVGSFNTVIGAQADVASNNLNYATAIGAEAVVSSSNTVVLGRTADTVRIPGNLNVSGNFTGNFTVPASNITGVLAAANGGTGLSLPGASGNFVRSDGTNWTSSVLQASDIPTGSTNYIQNIPGIGQQSASFNITGGGTANIFNAATQFNIGGQRMLSAPGPFNTFVGRDAGAANVFGISNSFFGDFAGRSNTTGDSNSFFGDNAGVFSTGNSNSFFGAEAGRSNSTGANNTMIGSDADATSGNLSNATAIGAGAQVSQSNSLVLGNNANVGIGTTAPIGKLQVVTANDTSPTIVTAWDTRHFVVGGTANTGGIGVSFDQTNNVGYVQSLRPNVDWGNLILQSGGGNVGIGTNTPASTLDVNGTVRIRSLFSSGSTPLCINDINNGVASCSSSIRYKQNINPFVSGLSLIKQLRPVSFNWKADSKEDLGLIAEEVAEAEPLLVTHNAKGEIEGVKYDRIGVVLVNAVNEQQEQIEQQQSQIKAQSDRLKKQQLEIDELKQIVCTLKPDAGVCKEINK